MADQKPYKEGTVKLTWVDPIDYTILNSRMFNSVDEAIANKGDLGDNWLIMQLEKTDGNQYEWKLLPYGQYKSYINGMRVSDNPFLKFGSIALMGLGVVFLFKLATIKK